MGDAASVPALQSDEASLIVELRAGSDNAFAQLIASFHEPVYSLLARTTYDRADAACLTQEVFVKLSREVKNVRGESSLAIWIYRVALREAASRRRCWIRNKKHAIPTDLDSTGRECRTPMLLKDALVNRAEGMCEIAVYAQTQAQVEGALRKVPEPIRTTLILRDIEGFLYEEIAEIQNVNLRTVKSRLVRGRACLRALLAVPGAHLKRVESSGIEMPLEKRLSQIARRFLNQLQ